VKLPLDLKPRQTDNSSRTLSLFFTVYNVRVGHKSTWKRAKKMLGSQQSDVISDFEETDSGGSSRLRQIACGFLPVATNSCLVENGMHDVRIIYAARMPPQEYCDRGIIDPSTLVLVDKNDAGESQASLVDDSFAEETASSDSKSDRLANGSKADLSDLASIADDSRGGKSKSSANVEPISLSVSRRCLWPLVPPKIDVIPVAHLFLGANFRTFVAPPAKRVACFVSSRGARPIRSPPQPCVYVKA